uniref:TF-B3 domain-containing protein n=1 Tax=Davidia involucrata TaxID=16924 RepID=A0A5B7CC39_DAVIN
MEKKGVNINESNNMVTDNRPCFFRIILPGLTTEHLRIPLHFIQHISKDVADRALLRGPSGGHWHVKLCKNANGMFLRDGWPEFLRDHSLGDSEFLLFRYDGNMCFNVQIFDKSGLERINEPVTGAHQEAASSSGKKRRDRPRKDHVGSLHPPQSISCKHDPGYGPSKDTHDCGQQYSGSGTSKSQLHNGLQGKGKHNQCRESNKDQHYQSIHEVHQESELSIGKKKPGRPRKNYVCSPQLHQPVSCGYGADQHLQGNKSDKLKKCREEKGSQVEIKIEDADLPIQEMDLQLKKFETKKDTQRKTKVDGSDLPTSKTNSHALRRQHPVKEEQATVWKRAESFNSRFPHFGRCLQEHNMKSFLLNIPISFAETHLPRVTTEMILRNSKGKTWKVNYIPKERKCAFYGGWLAFVRDNNLEQGDTCIFELVDKTEIQVHIFR